MFLQLHREEAARNELEAKLNTTNDQLEELQKKYDIAVREKDDEIRQLKEEVCVCV
jgi:plasmid maintenance system antidote protein VapI